jgi:hypothetical protein
MSNKFSIDLDSYINEMFRENISLCPYAKRNSDRVLNRIVGHWGRPLELLFSFNGRRHGISLLKRSLMSEEYYENPLFYMLFKAFAYAEYRFVKNYIPQNSQEERLTGHLISELSNGLAIIESTFKSRAIDIYGKEARLEFFYADMSSNRMEKFTGADFAIIFHVNLPDYPENIKAIVCQAKKFRKSRDIETHQLEQLISWANKAAYYCFYDMEPSERTAPLITSAEWVKGKVDNKDKGHSIDRLSILEYSDGIPLSMFLVFELLDVYGDKGKLFDSVYEAKRFVTGEREEFPRVAKVLLVSIGGILGKQELRDLSSLFPFRSYEG